MWESEKEDAVLFFFCFLLRYWHVVTKTMFHTQQPKSIIHFPMQKH